MGRLLQEQLHRASAELHAASRLRPGHDRGRAVPWHVHGVRRGAVLAQPSDQAVVLTIARRGGGEQVQERMNEHVVR